MPDSNVKQEIDTLKSDVAKLRDDIGELVSALVDLVGDKAAATRTRVESEAKERLDELRAALERARERGGRAVGQMEHQIEERPLLSVLAAFGIGLILGKLLDRK